MTKLLLKPKTVGFVIGIILALAMAIFCPNSDLEPGDSRILMGFVGAIFLVPGSIGTIYFTKITLKLTREIRMIRYVWLVAILFFTLAISLSTWSEWSSAKRFAAEGKTTSGKILELHPEFHDTIIVAYSISGTDYRNQSSCPLKTGGFYIGEVIPVYYYSSEPASAFFVKPEWRLDMVLFSWFLASGVGPIWLIGLWGVIQLKLQN